MHSLFITLLEMITWAKEGAGLFRLITVLQGGADTCTVLYCTVLYCTVLQGGADTVLRAGEIIIKKLKWHKYTAGNTTNQ